MSLSFPTLSLSLRAFASDSIGCVDSYSTFGFLIAFPLSLFSVLVACRFVRYSIGYPLSVSLSLPILLIFKLHFRFYRLQQCRLNRSFSRTGQLTNAPFFFLPLH
jgi:hypothetical protein